MSFKFGEDDTKSITCIIAFVVTFENGIFPLVDWILEHSTLVAYCHVRIAALIM
jgi:hypothetical protein